MWPFFQHFNLRTTHLRAPLYSTHKNKWNFSVVLVRASLNLSAQVTMSFIYDCDCEYYSYIFLKVLMVILHATITISITVFGLAPSLFCDNTHDSIP